MSYRGRPSASPVVAGLFAAGLIGRRHRVLDVGCGDGTDCLALASWGVRRVAGLDSEAERLSIASRRARALGFAVDWHLGSITRLHPCFTEGQFDVVIDSLCWNNISADFPHATPAYVRQVWRVLTPGGLFVLQARHAGHPLEIDAARDVLPPTFLAHFVMSPAVTTHLPELRRTAHGRAFAEVQVSIGRRRARRVG
ncbi:MAG: class I SAM-dependent methyltransferase [Myxococcaceae bacterium]